MKTKPDYKLLHKLRRGAAHMTRDQLLLKLREAEAVIRNLDADRALAAERDQDFTDAVRAMDIARERVAEANKEIEATHRLYEETVKERQLATSKLQTALLDIERLERHRNALINVIDKITGTD